MKSNNSPVERAKRALKATQRAILGLENSLDKVVEASKIINQSDGDVIVTGIGKSGFVGQKFTASMTSLGRRAFFLHPTEALHGDLGMLSEGDIFVALSFSGESKEVVGIARYAKKNFNVPIIAICKNAKSSLGKISDCCIEICVEEEGSPNGVAPMASTTATLAVSDMLTASVMDENFKAERFATYHPGGSLGLSLKKVKDFMTKGKLLPKVKETDNFLTAVAEINNKKLGVTAVVDVKGRVVGAMTDGDIRRFVLSHKDVKEARAKDAMTSKPKCIFENDSLQTALQTMEHHKITSIFVTNTRKQLSGIIHVHDIIEQMPV